MDEPSLSTGIPSSSASFEAQHVHLVYEHIASDFSRTRHSTWPFVQEWLQGLKQSSLVLDAGCGNGKYLGVDSVLSSSDRPGPVPQRIVHKKRSKRKGKEPILRGDVAALSRTNPEENKDPGSAELTAKSEARDLDSSLDPSPTTPTPTPEPKPKAILSIGLDMSVGLLSIASKEKGHEVVRGDCFNLGCWRIGAFDHAISIATIHHFATEARRIESVKQLIKAVTPSAPSSTPHTSPTSSSPTANKILIVVWALEQDSSLSGFGSARKKGKVKGGAVRADQFLDGEGEGEGVRKREGEGDKDGEHKVGRQDERDVFVPWELQRKEEANLNAKVKGRSKKKGKERQDKDEQEEGEPTVTDETPAKAKDQTFQRYYHLFKRGELTELVKAAAKDLGARFEGTLDEDVDGEAGEEEGGGIKGLRIEEEEEEEDGIVLWVRMKEERWERENWVGDIEVEWRRGPVRRM